MAKVKGLEKAKDYRSAKENQTGMEKRKGTG